MSTHLDTVGTWSATSTSISAVLAALARLRRGDARSAVHTSVVTLVVVGDDRLDLDHTLGTVHRLGDHHPSRVVVVRRRGDRPGGINARVGVHLVSRAGRCLGLDDVALDVSGPAGAHLDSLVEPLTLPDLPVVMWSCHQVPSADDALVGAADHVLVDSATSGGARALARLAALSERVAVTDLAWLRLTPLRRRLTDGLRRPEATGILDSLTGASVGGDHLEQAYLAGWLTDRLGALVIHRAPGPASVHLHARMGTASVVVMDGEEIATAVGPADGRHWSQIAPGRQPTSAALVGQALAHLQPDPVLAGALAAASGRAPAALR